jgi:hypothetical protein
MVERRNTGRPLSEKVIALFQQQVVSVLKENPAQVFWPAAVPIGSLLADLCEGFQLVVGKPNGIILPPAVTTSGNLVDILFQDSQLEKPRLLRCLVGSSNSGDDVDVVEAHQGNRDQDVLFGSIER